MYLRRKVEVEEGSEGMTYDGRIHVSPIIGFKPPPVPKGRSTPPPEPTVVGVLTGTFTEAISGTHTDPVQHSLAW